MVVIVGVAVTTGPEVPLNPVAGLQLYPAAPLAVKVTPGPVAHMLGADGLTTTVGVGLTDISTTAVPVQLPFVPVTV